MSSRIIHRSTTSVVRRSPQLAALLLLSAMACAAEPAAEIERAATPEPQQLPEPASVEPAAEVLAPVYVTGNKRPETLQDTAASVAVIRDADRAMTPRLYDLLSRIPNVISQGGNNLPAIRGSNGNGVAEGGGGAVTGGRPRVSTYVDGVARGFSFALDGIPSTWDVAQVEVYRGAQSTTQGRNAIAGALVVATQDPIMAPEFAARLGFHNQNPTGFAKLMANLPWAAADLAFRITGETTRGDNFVRVRIPEYAGKDADGIEQDSARAKLLWTPRALPALKLRLGVDYQRQEQPSNPYTVDRGERDRLTGIGNYARQQAYNLVYSARPEWSISEHWRLEAVLARQDAQNRYPSLIGVTPASLDVRADTVEDSLETRLLYTAGGDSRTSAVVGIYAFQRDRDEAGTPGSAFVYSATDTARSGAGFADARLQLAPAWDLRVGGRLERETQDRVFNSPFGLALTVDEDVNVFLPKLGVDWHWTPDVTVGLSYYHGLQPGGGGVSFTSFTPYQFAPERSQTTELSLRTSWPQERLTVNANLFHTRNRDQQYFAEGPNGANDTIILNADRTRAVGAELETIWRPWTALRLTAGLGLLNTKVLSFGDPANDARLNGNRLGFDPGYTANLAVDWTVFSGFTIGGTAVTLDDYAANIENRPDLRGGDYTTVNVHAAYRREVWSVQVYANNLLDRTGQIGDFGFGSRVVTPPLTLGFAIEVRL